MQTRRETLKQSAVLAPMGTTAPFSAMSGAVTVTSLLSARLPAPKALVASCTVLASKPALLKAAMAKPG